MNRFVTLAFCCFLYLANAYANFECASSSSALVKHSISVDFKKGKAVVKRLNNDTLEMEELVILSMLGKDPASQIIWSGNIWFTHFAPGTMVKFVLFPREQDAYEALGVFIEFSATYENGQVNINENQYDLSCRRLFH